MSLTRRAYEALPLGMRKTAGRLAAALPPGIRYGAAYRKQMTLLREAEQWSADDLDRYALTELRRVLQRAVALVPRYRRLFAEAGLDAESLDSLEQLTCLPLTSKQDLLTRRHEFTPPGSGGAAHARLCATCGTSGRPTSLLVSYEASAREWAFMTWHWHRAGMRLDGRRAVFRGHHVPGRSSGVYWYDEPVRRARVFSPADLTADTLPTYLRGFREFRPDALHGYPSLALVLARLMRAAGETPPPLELVLLGSEGVTAEERAELSAFYGCPTFTWYGHTEKCVLAFDAEEPGVFVPEWRYGVIELVAGDGSLITEPGKLGQVVGTGFLNDATVVVRYMTDDWAEWLVPPYGRHLADARLCTLTPHRGREVLIAVDGSEIPLRFPYDGYEHLFVQVLERQFVQLAPGRVRLDLVLAPGAGPEVVPGLSAFYRSRLSGRIDVTVRAVEHIERTPGSKYVPVIHEADPRTGDRP